MRYAALTALLASLSIAVNAGPLVARATGAQTTTDMAPKCGMNDHFYKFLLPAADAALEEGQEFEVVYCELTRRPLFPE